jgi:Protein of unknown function (DUF2894)
MSDAGRSPLAGLNAYIGGVVAARLEALEPDDRPDAGELPNARRFRLAWQKHQVTDRVAQAVARRPANAGPLHSHVLVLQALDLMGDLSQDYLRRFLQHVEALQWLEQARDASPRVRPAAKPPARKPRKPAAPK